MLGLSRLGWIGVPGVAPVERPWEFAPIQWLGNLTQTESWRAVVPAH